MLEEYNEVSSVKGFVGRWRGSLYVPLQVKGYKDAVLCVNCDTPYPVPRSPRRNGVLYALLIKRRNLSGRRLVKRNRRGQFCKENQAMILSSTNQNWKSWVLFAQTRHVDGNLQLSLYLAQKDIVSRWTFGGQIHRQNLWQAVCCLSSKLSRFLWSLQRSIYATIPDNWL
jgi:hypothetical protein